MVGNWCLKSKLPTPTEIKGFFARFDKYYAPFFAFISFIVAFALSYGKSPSFYANRSDFLVFSQMLITIMALVISFDGFVFVEVTKSLSDIARKVETAVKATTNVEQDDEKLQSGLKDLKEKSSQVPEQQHATFEEKIIEIRDKLDLAKNKLGKVGKEERKIILTLMSVEGIQFYSFVTSLACSGASIAISMYLILEAPSFPLFILSIELSIYGIGGFVFLILAYFAYSHAYLNHILSQVSPKTTKTS